MVDVNTGQVSKLLQFELQEKIDQLNLKCLQLNSQRKELYGRLMSLKVREQMNRIQLVA